MKIRSTLLREEITSLHREIENTVNNSSVYDSDKVGGVRNQKFRVLESESDRYYKRVTIGEF